MKENLNSIQQTTQENSYFEPCFFVTHSCNSREIDVRAFCSLDDAKRSIVDEILPIDRDLTAHRVKHDATFNLSGSASLYVPDSDYFHSWQIIEGTIRCPGGVQNLPDSPSNTKSVLKKCFIVMHSSHDKEVRFGAFSTIGAANAEISRSSSIVDNGLCLIGFDPDFGMKNDVGGFVSVPDTVFHHEWKIITSTICTLYSNIPIISSQSPSDEKAVIEKCYHCGTEVIMRWDVNDMGFSAFCPYCGATLMLCEECQHTHGTCSIDTEENCCRYGRIDTHTTKE